VPAKEPETLLVPAPDLPPLPRQSAPPVAALKVPEGPGVLLVIGESGAGKTRLLSELANQDDTAMVDGSFSQLGGVQLRRATSEEAGLSVASRFPSGDEAYKRLTAVGFSSVPSMLKPPEILAPSEAYRAALAVAAQRSEAANGTLLVDEFTSVLDRKLAAGVSVSTSKLGLTRRLVASDAVHARGRAANWASARDCGRGLPRSFGRRDRRGERGGAAKGRAKRDLRHDAAFSLRRWERG
jgi:predicted ABC-type transport system involved in lysophospholipase L1 biosynthesis ATPase subunit